MKAKLLKRLRREAHKEYGIVASANCQGGVDYFVFYRSTKDELPSDGHDIDTIKRELRDYRKRYILRRASQIRIKMYNHQLKQL